MYEPLHSLFRGDEAKVRNAMKVFQRITKEDLERLICARRDEDWTSLGRLAHKLKSGCMQIGQRTTGDALSALEATLSHTPGSDTLEDAFSAARDEVRRVLDHVGEYLNEKGAQSE